MLTVIGYIVVFGSIIGGFLMHGGVLSLLIQVSEFIIIGGAALGSLIVAAPGKVLNAIFARVLKALTGSGLTKAHYMELFHLMFELFSTMRKNGDMAVEKDIDDPSSSPLFSKYPTFLANQAARNLLCDSLRLIVSGSAKADELAHLMDEELATYEEESHRPAALVAKVADALPGLGIVAAVLGIIITMQSIDQGPEVIGHKIASALVGTFVGVLCCYGLFQPLATKMEMLAQEEKKYLECIKIGLLSYLHGAAPIIAVEYARRVIFSGERPSAAELEESCRGVKAQP
ncbi:MAG: flagellar motor stator protein MotA [Candidatus Binatia bacterium]|nr:flagellar motor stator protein MotA [Candidatus Binatia bacterium]